MLAKFYSPGRRSPPTSAATSAPAAAGRRTSASPSTASTARPRPASWPTRTRSTGGSTPSSTSTIPRSRRSPAPAPASVAGARHRPDLRHSCPDLPRLVPPLVRSGRVHGGHGRRRPRLARHQQRPPALRPEREPPRGRRPALRQRDRRRRPQLSPRVRPRPPDPRPPAELRAPQGLHLRRRDRDRAQARPRAGRAAHARGARRRLGPPRRGLARRRLPGPLRLEDPRRLRGPRGPRRRAAQDGPRPGHGRGDAGRRGPRRRRRPPRLRRPDLGRARVHRPLFGPGHAPLRGRPGHRPQIRDHHRTGRAREDHRPVHPGPRGRSRLPPGLSRPGRRLPVPVRLRGGQRRHAAPDGGELPAGLRDGPRPGRDQRRAGLVPLFPARQRPGLRLSQEGAGPRPVEPPRPDRRRRVPAEHRDAGAGRRVLHPGHPGRRHDGGYLLSSGLYLRADGPARVGPWRTTTR